MSKQDKMFKTCFITDVVISDSIIRLSDPSHNEFVILKNNSEVISQFKDWYQNVFSACIPQQLTLIEYSIEEKNEYEVQRVVKAIRYRLLAQTKEIA